MVTEGLPTLRQTEPPRYVLLPPLPLLFTESKPHRVETSRTEREEHSENIHR